MEDVLNSLIAWGIELDRWNGSQYSCIAWQTTAGSTGYDSVVHSFSILWALCRDLTSVITLMLGRWSKMTLIHNKSLTWWQHWMKSQSIQMLELSFLSNWYFLRGISLKVKLSKIFKHPLGSSSSCPLLLQTIFIQIQSLRSHVLMWYQRALL